MKLTRADFKDALKDSRQRYEFEVRSAAAAKLLETQFGINYNVFHIGGGKSGYHLFAIDADKREYGRLKNIGTIAAYSEGALSGILWAFGHTS